MIVNLAMKNSEIIPPELIAIMQNVYEPSGLKITSPVQCETESAEYGACRFGLNGFIIGYNNRR